MTTLKRVLGFILLFLIINLYTTYYYQTDMLAVFSIHSIDKNPYIIVDLNENKLYLFKDGKLYKTYPVAGGTEYTPSPLGTWTIVSKANWGEGFGGTWMGFNVPWGKYGLHGTDEPWTIGKSLSKGCIRMHNDDIKELRKVVYVGTKITIIKGAYGPFGEGFRTLKPGAIGSDVYEVQKTLKEQGYYNGWVDGKYGAGMQNAVYKFQKEKGLTQTKYLSAEFYEALGIKLFE